MNAKNALAPRKRISPPAAVGLGIAAGFAFLIGLGAALHVLPQDFAVFACFGIALCAAVGLALSQK